MTTPDGRLGQAPVVLQLADEVAATVDLVGLYAGGSLALGDYRPAVSDLDLVAVVGQRLAGRPRRQVRSLHERLLQGDPRAVRLHCVYVARDDAADVLRPHPTWAHGELYRRALSGIARAEVLRSGVPVVGPSPNTLLPPVDHAALRAAVALELTGYWAGAVAKRHLWTQDVYVDLGLTVLARAQAALDEDRLITKTEALQRLSLFGVPTELVAEVQARRDGVVVDLSEAQRRNRGEQVRRLVGDGIERLLTT